MSEPSVEDIVAKLEGPWGCDLGRWHHDLGAVQAEVLALIADWRKRGDALERLASGKKFEQTDNPHYEFAARVDFAHAALKGAAK